MLTLDGGHDAAHVLVTLVAQDGLQHFIPDGFGDVEHVHNLAVLNAELALAHKVNGLFAGRGVVADLAQHTVVIDRSNRCPPVINQELTVSILKTAGPDVKRLLVTIVNVDAAKIRGGGESLKDLLLTSEDFFVLDGAGDQLLLLLDSGVRFHSVVDFGDVDLRTFTVGTLNARGFGVGAVNFTSHFIKTSANARPRAVNAALFTYARGGFKPRFVWHESRPPVVLSLTSLVQLAFRCKFMCYVFGFKFQFKMPGLGRIDSTFADRQRGVAHAWQARLPVNFLPKPTSKRFPPSTSNQNKTANADCSGC